MLQIPRRWAAVAWMGRSIGLPDRTCLAECRTLGGCRTGEAKNDQRIPFALQIRHPYSWPGLAGGRNREPELLASCYRDCFKLAHENGVRTIAFPAISCGIYGYPIPDAARIAVREANQALGTMPEIERVLFTCFSDDVFNAYQAALKGLVDE